MAKKAEITTIIINKIELVEFKMNLLGTSPMIMNRFAQKAWQELLLPSRSANKASLEQTLKHDPLQEYRGAMYRNRDQSRPTFIHLPNGAVHGAMCSAALDIPGAAKAQIERLTQIIDVNIDLYGVPEMFMAMVRNSGMNRAPDVRTRPIFPKWGCTVTVQFVKNTLTERACANLLGAGGLIVGIGDWRPQKGGSFGRFTLVADDDPAFRQLVKTGGRAAQLKAYENPGYHDENTEELMTWFEAEVKRREMEGQLNKEPKTKTKTKGNSKKAAELIAQHVIVEDRYGNFEGRE